jgi:glucose-1-phosphate cytidylyltransferase
MNCELRRTTFGWLAVLADQYAQIGKHIAADLRRFTQTAFEHWSRTSMKVVILAGGYGSRIGEETHLRPKPMIEIGGKPILWHIMKLYSAHGLNDFIICCGYKGYMIKEYFANYFLHVSDATFDLAENRTEIHQTNSEPWRVTVVDTGEDVMTGGRLKRVERYIGRENFCMTYGDGVSNIDIGKLIAFHREQKCLATLTAVQPPGRFGLLEINEHRIKRFEEKPADGGWISGGFFVLSPQVFGYLAGDETTWEREPLERLATEGNLAAYRHHGFWRCMDTMRDRVQLEEFWQHGRAPWKVWA